MLARPSSSSIGGLVVKLAVAIRDLISDDSASPGFDSRPMQECTTRPTGVSFLLLLGIPPETVVFALGYQRDQGE